MVSHSSHGGAANRYAGNGWDVTVTCPLAESYVNAAAREAGAAAELAASRKEEKYRDIDGRYIFEPIAVETLGIHNE